MPKVELPTNEVDYSKIKYNKRGRARRKTFLIKIIGFVLYFIIILILVASTENETIQMGLFVAFMIGVIALVVTKINEINIPKSPHVFVFSFSQYFIHRLIYQIAILVLVIWLPLQFENNIYDMENANKKVLIFVYGVGIIALSLRFFYQFGKSITSEFIVESGGIRYKHETIDLFSDELDHSDIRDRYYKMVYYDINSINKVKENLNTIIIYGNIEKTILRERVGNTQTSKQKKIERLKIIKI